MEHELTEINTFLHTIPPFDQLTIEIIAQLTKAITINYLRKESHLPPKGCDEKTLYIIRKGALAYSSLQGELLGKYGEGDICSVFIFPDQIDEIKVHAEEDTLLYCLPFLAFSNITANFNNVIRFFENSAEERLNTQMTQLNEDAILSSSLMDTSVSQFCHGPVATIESYCTIQQAAIKMTELSFSCLVVIEADKPVGIITDKDIRRRCVAKGLSFNQPVSDIMTKDMLTLNENDRAYDALMLMTGKRIHHLPVTQNGKLTAMVTITDLMNNEGQNAINITNMIRRASNLDELKVISALLPKLQVKMAKLGTTADHIGKSISAITAALTIRLIEMAEEKYGPAPAPWAWLAAGSQARQEQFAHSDQDNAIIYSDDVITEDKPWFKHVATFVSDGLATCGFIYCPGDIMATNTQWCQPQSTWHQYFDQWVTKPRPQALLNSSVFFDLVTIYGDNSLIDQVREKLLQKTKGNSLFLAHLSRNALMLKPPLGFFRDFVLISNGKNKASLDLKHNGIAPIVDLARIYALAEGIAATNTIERLKLASGTPSLTKASAANLIDAYEFLGILRMNHQATKIQAGEAPDNYLAPKNISKLEREHLKDAFKVIKTMQDNRQTTL
ncbi:putative nucleotidyltransferase substrate binding domain-containing protein [Thalassotalea profundi]|uniref:Cyclic nucleotide-binding protein n=1 Tax=Thalassotalea profundi TaxID=2036687 RepID=A0ABQ3J001_9GAMM|nr:putative nucleotidyltransferase substrate binding domain-containing protein [Thalassotalea profundi]GHE97234.1 cyclic nucleotide-binding protein [Thalassotalea profundi]